MNAEYNERIAKVKSAEQAFFATEVGTTEHTKAKAALKRAENKLEKWQNEYGAYSPRR